MSKILQLKGKNFLGIPLFDKKIYPITKTAAVQDDAGNTLDNKITELESSLTKVIEVDETDLEIDQADYNRYIVCSSDLMTLKINQSSNGSITKIDFTAGDDNIVTLADGVKVIGSLDISANSRYVITVQMNVAKCEEVVSV